MNYPEIELTGNIGAGGVFPLLNSGFIVFTSDADHAMVYPEMSGTVVNLTSSVALTATRNLVAPLKLGFFFIVYNNTTGGQAINIAGTTGAGASIPNTGQPYVVSCDGTNYALATSPSGVASIMIAAANGFQGSSSGGITPILTLNVDSSHVLPTKGGSASTYLNGAGAYTVPPSGGGYTLGGALAAGNLSVSSGAGLGATGTITGLDGNHSVTITTGSSGVAPGPLFTVTFTGPKPNNTYPIVQSPETNLVYAGGGANTGYTALNPGGLSANTTYAFSVMCP